jgi:hypothetical protein
LCTVRQHASLFIFNYAVQPLRLIVRSGLDVPIFATRCLHACHHARAPSGGRWNCGREMSGKFCINADFHVTFRDLLHAIKLRHGNDGFTSPPKKDFFALKIRRLRPGANPRTWVPKASALPVDHRSRQRDPYFIFILKEKLIFNFAKFSGSHSSHTVRLHSTALTV